jgi:hypothetical protein
MQKDRITTVYCVLSEKMAVSYVPANRISMTRAAASDATAAATNDNNRRMK